jgi:hypothetical protein
MKQILTRVDDQLAEDLKSQASVNGESVNSYVNRLLRVAVTGPNSSRHLWKAAAIADGRLLARPTVGGPRSRGAINRVSPIVTPAGYVDRLVSDERGER